MSFKSIAASIAAFIIAVAIAIALSWTSLIASRLMANYAEETNRQVESQSRRRVDGTNSGILDLCLNMQTSSDTTMKRAYASRIVTEAGATTVALTPDAQACVSEARTALN